MKMLFKCLAVCFALSLSLVARAELIWDWQFEIENLGVISPDGVVQGRAIVSNDVNSTVALDPLTFGSPRMGGVGLNNPTLDGDMIYSVDGGFGLHEPFPWNTFLDAFNNISLSPGESVTFDFIWQKSALPFGFEVGDYSVLASIGICLDGCRDSFEGSREYKERTLSWSVKDVATVPEPGGLALSVAMFGLLCLVRLRKV